MTTDTKTNTFEHAASRASADLEFQSLLPLAEIERLRSRLEAEDALFPVTPFDPRDRALLDDDPVVRALTGSAVSNFCMEPASLAYMKEMITRYRPATILEYGSGLSTAVLSAHQRMMRDGDPATRYISIEQSIEFADQTRGLLRRSGTSELVTLLMADIVPVCVHGHDSHCYDMAGCGLDDALRGRSIDLVLIDGPAGGGDFGIPGARFATVPLLRHRIASGCPFFLDDVFRDTELAIARAWSRLDYLRIMGLKAVGNGVLIGRYTKEQ